MKPPLSPMSAHVLRTRIIDMLSIVNGLTSPVLSDDLRASYSMALELLYTRLYDTSTNMDSGVTYVNLLERKEANGAE